MVIKVQDSILGHKTNDLESVSWRRINPLTLILINAVLPVVNMIFPSDKTVILSMTLSYMIFIIVGRYKTAIKSVFWIALGLLLYAINNTSLHSGTLEMMIKVSILFIPSILIAILIITGYNSSEILSALQRLHLPKILIIGLTITIRYIPTFKWEFSIIKQAMNIRGVKFSIFHPIRTFEYLIVPQLFRCVSLSLELTAAGLTKGIASANKRSSYFYNKMGITDYFVIAIFLIGTIVIIGGFI